MVSAFVGQGRPGRDEGPSQREPALGRRPSTGRPRARTVSGAPDRYSLAVLIVP